MKKYIVIILMALFFLHIGCSRYQNNQGKFILTNDAKQEISYGIVEICGQKFKFEHLQQDKSIEFYFMVKTDSHYKIIINFISGQKLTKEIGYVTSGLKVNDLLIIKNDDIILQSYTTIK